MSQISFHCSNYRQLRYELANYFGKDGSETRGVVTRKISGELIHGNTLMGAVDFRYPALAKYGLKTHTVEAVSHVVSQLESYGNLGASEVFSGYLMIDALVGNQDRHHQNWGAIEYNGRRYLAPSFDHGASCARNLSDNERDERLNTKDLGYSILTFSARARSAFYSEATLQRPLGTHRAFLEYCIVSGIEKTTWLTKLENIREVDLSKLLDSIPPVRMSDTTRKFTLQLLMANRARLLDL